MGATKVQDAKVHRAHVRTTLTKDGCVQRLEPLVLRSAGGRWPIRGEMLERLKAAGLLPLARMMEGIPKDFLDRDLLTALVDRWNPTTHTFQFPWAEMGVSLKDVSMLLGLPIKGEPIAKPADPKNWAQDMDARFCKHVPGYDSVLTTVTNKPSSKAKKPTEELRGFSKKPAQRRKISAEPPQLKESVQLATKKSTKLKEPDEEEDPAKLHGPTLAWLRSTYKKLFELKELTEEQSQCAVEIYVLWLFGWVMFTNTHGDCVEPRLIEYAMDIAYSKIEDIKEISYGSAVLAGLYRANCDSCMRIGKKSSYVGCPLLLNLWSYEYLLALGCPMGTFFKHPGSVYKDDVDAPTVGSYWTNSQFKKDKRVGYDSYSQCIDSFRPCWVNWNPYTQDKLQQRAPGGLSSLCTRDSKFWLTKRNLIYDVFVEEYAPQRFMRQFDLEQRVPPPLGNPVPKEIHAWSRRRCEANSGWARKQSMDTYIETWRVACDDDSLWPSDRPYDPESYEQYNKWYLQTDVVRCHQFVPQQGQSYTVPDRGYSCLEGGASWYIAATVCSELDQEVSKMLMLHGNGNGRQIAPVDEVKAFCSKIKLLASRWRNFKYAAVPPKCLSELRLTSVADEAATALDYEDEMDQDGHVNEEKEAPLEQSDSVWFSSSDNDVAVPFQKKDNDVAAKEDGSNQHVAVVAADVPFSADETDAAMSLVCMLPKLQNDGMSSEQEQELEQLRNEEEASATCESQTKLVMFQHKRGFRAQQIKVCYRRKRETALPRQANM